MEALVEGLENETCIALNDCKFTGRCLASLRFLNLFEVFSDLPRKHLEDLDLERLVFSLL